MKKEDKKPQVIYANCVNLAGLYSKIPIKCSLKEGSKFWWSEDGMFMVEKLGQDNQEGFSIFASEDKNEVKIWTEGVKTVMIFVGKFVKGQ